MTQIMKPKYKNSLDIRDDKVIIINSEDFMRALLERRARKFGHQLTEIVRGTPVEAFGHRSRGIWGQDDDIHSYNIKGIAFEYADVFSNPRKSAKYRRENPEVYSVIRVSLDKYNTDKDPLIYTDSNFLKHMKGLMDDLGFKGEIDYTEQGMQGKTYVSMSLIFPMDVIAQDLDYHLRVKYGKEHQEEQVLKREERKRNKASM